VVLVFFSYAAWSCQASLSKNFASLEIRVISVKLAGFKLVVRVLSLKLGLPLNLGQLNSKPLPAFSCLPISWHCVFENELCTNLFAVQDSISGVQSFPFQSVRLCCSLVQCVTNCRYSFCSLSSEG